MPHRISHCVLFQIGPVTIGTDYGVCCLFVPQIFFDEVPENVTEAQKYHDLVEKGSKNGEHNGLSILLDIENYNFGYHRVGTQVGALKF